MEYNVFNYGLSGVSDSDVLSLLIDDKKTVDLLKGYSVLDLARRGYSDFRALGLSHGRASRLAAAFELNNNHPSGNTKPSNADMSITKKIGSAGEVMDIKILDSIIVTDGVYYSFADEGLI